MDDLEEKADISASEDEEVDDRSHLKLLDAITSLDGKKKTRLLERTVHTSQISEFNFTAYNDSNKVNISDLMGTLSSSSHGKIKKQLKSVEGNDQVVSVPLPKHEKERIDRSVAYDQTSEVVSKWDSIVQKNREADQLIFPLDRPVLKLHTTDELINTIKPRTSLEIEVAALLKNNENVPTKTRELTPAEERALKAMDLNEAKERLAELRKHRALLSYKEAKHKWQKRIKSKKYHKVLRKEKMKNEKKSLEELQKTDPEGYMEKVMAVEKQRVEERMSLKHRGGSKFMKKQMIYGKYDDRARQSVQDMIQKNKELTQKTEVFESDSEGGVSMDSENEIDMLESAISSADNPWMKSTRLSKPSGYEPIPEVKTSDNILFSVEEDNGSEDETRDKRLLTGVVQKVIIEDKNKSQDSNVNNTSSNVINLSGNKDEVEATEEKKLKKEEKIKQFRKKEKRKSSLSEMEKIIVDKKEVVEEESKNEKGKSSSSDVKKISEKKRKVKQDNKNVTIKSSFSETENIDEIFKDFEKTNDNKNAKPLKSNTHEKVMTEESRKTKRYKKKREKEKERKKKQKQVKEENQVKNKEKEESENEEEDSEEETFISETLTRKTKEEDFEENDEDDEINNRLKSANRKSNVKQDKKSSEKQEDVYVDPKKLLSLEQKIDKTHMPDIVVDDSNIDDEEQQRMTIAQAFADDDVIEEFSKEKKQIANRDKPKDIDLTLPGWGEWGGEGIKISKRKKKRFIIKAPPGPPRRDRNLGNVIISEQKDKAISKYQVSDLPFPYLNVEQFEQSIRAPVGKTWNPETAYKQLVKPKIVTKLGTIIKPIDKEETFKKEKMKRKNVNDMIPTNEASTSNMRKRRKR